MPKIQTIFYANPDLYPPIINGTRLLAQAGFKVEILCRVYRGTWNVSYPASTSVRRIPVFARNSLANYLAFVFQVVRGADRKVVAFVGHDMHGFLPARLLASLLRKPLIYHIHELPDLSELATGGRLVYLFHKQFAHTADLVIVPDEERTRVLMAELALHRRPLIVANAPLKLFTQSDDCLHKVLKEQNRSFGKIVFRQSSVGPDHAIEASIRSIPFWHKRDWGFVVMGPGEADYINRLRQISSEVGVEDRFIILPPVSYDDVRRFTPGATVGHALYCPRDTNSRLNVTASNKNLEYMAAGLPLLVSDRPGLRAFVEKYGCGITADEQSPESIAAAINTLLGDDQLAQRMGAAGRRAFEEEFCYEKQYAPVINKLMQLASAG